ncbi:MAG: type II secretion system protein [Planctomycetota bacterium]
MASARGRHRAFSLVELLVVIAIIVALVGLLLVALRGAQDSAKRTKTLSTMQAFANACEEFKLEHDRFPGIIPDDALSAEPQLTTTQNALLDLLGGARAFHPIFRQREKAEYDAFVALTETKEVTFPGSGWRLAFNPERFGEGPVINGKQYGSYLSVDDTVVRVLTKQDDFMNLGGTLNPNAPPADAGKLEVPDLVDAWGQPIIYLRRFSPSGPLVGEDPTARPQFLLGAIDVYVSNKELGDLGKPQVNDMGAIEYSIFHGGEEATDTLAQIIRNAAFGDPDDPQGGTARGSFVLLSAGTDGVYFAVTDGPGTRDMPVTNIINDANTGNPKVVEGYDDVRVFGGG